MNLVQQYIERSTQGMGDHSHDSAPTLPDKKVLQISVQRARDFMRLKEEAKHYCLIELAQIRRLLLAIDERCELDGRVFQYEASMTWKSLQLPAALSVRDLERIDMLTGTRPDIVEKGEVFGTRVAGESEVVGTVRVITDVNEIHTFKEGEILVARMTDPTWYPLFAQARGIITEVGGWLSHAAIVAREYDLPAIVGANGVCNQLATGDVVRMTLGGSIEKVSDRRADDSPLREAANEHTTGDHLPDHLSQGEREQRNVYQMTARKLFSYSQSVERRAMKQRVSDRRSTLRLTANGEVQKDRRLANRLANAQNMRKAG